MNAPIHTASHPNAPVAFGPFVLDAAEARLTRHGQPVALTGRPLEVLGLLAAHPQQLLSKDAVLDAVWGHRHVTESVLKVAINTLRAALGDDAKAPRYVETVPRRGYRFVAAVHAAGAPEAAAIPVDAPPSPGNLPAPAAGLVGREAAQAQVQAALQQHRLVTLTGLGGVGKTRLALAVARQAPPPDGAWLVRLDELAEPSRLLPAVAQALRLSEGAGASADALGRTLQPLQLRLVLDNAEHLVDAVAALVAALLTAAPGLQILVTSQQALRLAGEQVLPLAPLDLPGDLADAAPTPNSYAAAQLFCQRIAQHQPGYTPEPPEHADIAAICRALDGVPLALELAAARVPLLGVAGVRARLDERFALLTRAPRDAAARHRTLSAALDWTFHLLTPAEQAALQRLAVFAGSFTAQAAEAVLSQADLAGPGEALDLVESLREHSLISTQPGAGETRLRLFDSVRRYALGHLAATGQEQAARTRHLAWMRQRFEAADALYLETPFLIWIAPLRAEADSLRSALQFGLDPAAPPAVQDDAIRLTAASTLFWARLGLRHEAQRWLRAAAALPAKGTTALWLLHASGVFGAYSQMGSPVEAQAALQQSRQALWAAGDRKRSYFSWYMACYVEPRVTQQPDFDTLIRGMQACVEDHWGPMARRLLLIAQSMQLRSQGDMAGYRELSVRIAVQIRALGAVSECWSFENAEAQALAVMGQLDPACALMARAVTEIRAGGWIREQLQALTIAACLHLWRDGGEAGLALAREAARLLLVDDMAWWMADALAWAAWHDGRADDAARIQCWADAQARQRGDQRGPFFKAMREGLLATLHAAGTPLPQDDAAQAVAAWPQAEVVALALGQGAAD